MYIIDTNTFTQYLRDRDKGTALERKITGTPVTQLHITIITAYQILRGIFATIHASHSTASFRFFESMLVDLRLFSVLPYTEDAEAIFRGMSPAVHRVGTQDCRISAIAISLGYTVITNDPDFRQIPGVNTADWTIEPEPSS